MAKIFADVTKDAKQLLKKPPRQVSTATSETRARF